MQINKQTWKKIITLTTANEQVDKKIEQLLHRKESITKSMDEQKVSLWELEGHIKKVRLLLRIIFYRF